MLIHLPHIPYLWSNFWGVGLVYCRLPRKLTVRTCRPKPKKETHLPTPVFQVRTVSFREGDEKTGWNKSAVSSASLNCLSRAMQCVASTLSCRRYPKKQAAWGYTNSIQFLQSYAEICWASELNDFVGNDFLRSSNLWLYEIPCVAWHLSILFLQAFRGFAATGLYCTTVRDEPFVEGSLTKRGGNGKGERKREARQRLTHVPFMTQASTGKIWYHTRFCGEKFGVNCI